MRLKRPGPAFAAVLFSGSNGMEKCCLPNANLPQWDSRAVVSF